MVTPCAVPCESVNAWHSNATSEKSRPATTTGLATTDLTYRTNAPYHPYGTLVLALNGDELLSPVSVTELGVCKPVTHVGDSVIRSGVTDVRGLNDWPGRMSHSVVSDAPHERSQGPGRPRLV